jgi:hypothetical protein
MGQAKDLPFLVTNWLHYAQNGGLVTRWLHLISEDLARFGKIWQDSYK